MIPKVSLILRLALIVGLSLNLVALPEDAWAQRRGGHAAHGSRSRPNVSRQGPARSGSFKSAPQRSRPRQAERSSPNRNERRGGGPERMDSQRGPDRGPNPGRDRDNRRRDDLRQDRRDELRDDQRDNIRDDPRDNVRDDRRGRNDDNRDDQRDNRRDRVDDRRDDYRRYSRGRSYTTVWWSSNSCSQTVFVVVDGYSYYQCDSAWFSRTYYGGEVTYTVTDPPPGY
jgi:hypothetical protein